MSNATNKAIIRANAEGWNALSVKSALETQVKKDLQAAIEAWEASGSCDEFIAEEEVIHLLTSTYYSGGFMYDMSRCAPGQFQAVNHSRDAFKDADIEGARAWMANVPIGEEVHYQFRRESLEEEQVVVKTAGGWKRVYYKDHSMLPSEDHGPWLTAGIRQRVAEKIGAPSSSTFHQVFDEAVKDLY